MANEKLSNGDLAKWGKKKTYTRSRENISAVKKLGDGGGAMKRGLKRRTATEEERMLENREGLVEKEVRGRGTVELRKPGSPKGKLELRSGKSFKRK